MEASDSVRAVPSLLAMQSQRRGEKRGEAHSRMVAGEHGEVEIDNDHQLAGQTCHQLPHCQ